MDNFSMKKTSVFAIYCPTKSLKIKYHTIEDSSKKELSLIDRLKEI